jgi:hypothetical protein
MKGYEIQAILLGEKIMGWQGCNYDTREDWTFEDCDKVVHFPLRKEGGRQRVMRGVAYQLRVGGKPALVEGKPAWAHQFQEWDPHHKEPDAWQLVSAVTRGGDYGFCLDYDKGSGQWRASFICGATFALHFRVADTLAMAISLAAYDFVLDGEHKA